MLTRGAVDPEITEETVEQIIEHGTDGIFTGKRVRAVC